jgi:penicillin-binding protein 2
MFTSKKKLSPETVKKTTITTAVVLSAVFLGLILAFWNIQVVHHSHYLDLAIRNMTRRVDLDAPRGMILDRHRRIMSENKINFTLFLIPENVSDMAHPLRLASFFTGRRESQLQKTIEKYRNFPKFFQIPIKNNLPLSTVIFIETRQDEFPEFRIDVQPLRSYPNGKVAAHALGYISEISESELQSRAAEGYRLGDVIGRSGVEARYENYLRGVKGVQTVIKDNLEKIHTIASEEKPKIGDTAILTLDLELQQFIEQLFQPHRGVVAVMDLQTGGLLAMVCNPAFDPGMFSSAIDAEEWQLIVNDPQKPLQNKFIQGIYSPGSVFKIVMALTGLQEHVLDPSYTLVCTGSSVIYDRVWHCWNAYGHGEVNLVRALTHSCNVFFYNLGKRLDIDVIARYARLLGLGAVTGVDLPNEKTGLVPSAAWKLRTQHQKWFPGETISVAIGHGSLNATPAQILNLLATVALRGRMPRMHLLQDIENGGRRVFSFAPHFTPVPIDRENFETVIDGLYGVVNREGTGRAACIPGLDVCGKTGTSQIITKENPNYRLLSQEERFRPNSWFASFAPRDNPRIAMVVLVENGGDAGRIAAPLAAAIYRHYFKK